MTGKRASIAKSSLAPQQLQPWKDFPTYEEILAFSKSVSQLALGLQYSASPLLREAQGMPYWFYELQPDELKPEPMKESNDPFFVHLNSLICLATRYAESNKDKDQANERTPYVTIVDGKYGKGKVSMNHNKSPDLVAIWTDGQGAPDDPNTDDSIPPAPEEIPCLLVGKYISSRIFNSNALEAFRGQTQLKAPGQSKISSQIQDYMALHDTRTGHVISADEVLTIRKPEQNIPDTVVESYESMKFRQTRFGYIINETEAVMFQRAENGESKESFHFSPSIPIKAPYGQINAMMILWYYHVKYAVFNHSPGYFFSNSDEGEDEFALEI